MTVMEAINGGASALALPVFMAIVPAVVEDRHLVQANSAITMVRSAATIVGPLLASLLISSGPSAGLALNAALFALSACLCGQLRLGAPATDLSAGRRLIDDIREGWVDFVSRSWIWSVVFAFTLVNAVFAGVQSVIGPIVAVSHRGLGQSGWGLAIAAMGAGMFIAGIVMYRMRPRHPLVSGLVSATTIALPPLCLWAVPSALPVACAFLVAGIGMEVFSICWLSVLQFNVPQDRLGRVSTFDALGSYVAVPIGTSLAGVLQPIHGDLLLPLAALVILVSAAAPLIVPSVRSITANTWSDSIADCPEKD
ncbi:MFS family permease [Brooklawnia cerclae]|uniref:MFS family permease n=1 Tax=Brooklawnia cerclae TaxID=349934 RepID=A0ABX0SM12_9ACTN|nr:MFS family permease [Brooklawnia cerclae]